jgi:Protein of unknown function (DUF3574)
MRLAGPAESPASASEAFMRLGLSTSLMFCALAALPAAGSARAEMAGAEPGPSCKIGAAPMASLELLFGMSRLGGEPINDQEWQDFVDKEVTPRFPDGLSVLQAYGQWRGQGGQISKENSRLLMIWYQPKSDSEALIEAIREAYKKRFQQESVMRIDGASCVSF